MEEVAYEYRLIQSNMQEVHGTAAHQEPGTAKATHNSRKLHHFQKVLERPRADSFGGIPPDHEVLKRSAGGTI